MGNAANVSSAALAFRKAVAPYAQAKPRSLSFSLVAAAAALLVSVGLLVIAGWIFDIGFLKSLSPSWATMKLNTAVSFVLSGIALHISAFPPADAKLKGWKTLAAGTVLAIGMLTSFQHAFGIDLGIDELLMRQPTTAADSSRPGRMPAAAALGLVLLAAALLGLGSGKRVAPVILATISGSIAAIVVLGYLYDVELLYAIKPLSSMPLHTALLLGVASAGIYASRAGGSWERLRAHELAAAEEAFRRRMLFEQSRDGIVIFDAERRVYEANEKFAALLGYSVDEVLQLFPWDWDVKYHSRAIFMEEWPTVPVSSGELETQFRRRDGSIIDVVVSYTPASFNGVEYVYCSCRDVTAQKQADRTLHASEERFRRALANIPDVVVIYDAGLRIRYINNATRAITGLRSSDFIGRRDEEIFPAGVCNAYVPTLRDALESKLIRKVEFDVDLPKGGNRSLRMTCVPIVDRDGEVREIVGVTHDLTERRAAETRIRQSEEQYRELIEQAADGIFISDADGRFVLANSRCCELLGYERDELLSLDGTETWLGEETAATTRRMALLVAGQDLRYERELKRKDGSTFPAEISVKMLDSGGMQVIFHDITTRYRQERKIARLSRIHAVLSGINSTIVRVRDRRELFREACRIAVEAGKFDIAWIARVEPGQARARVLAQAGLPAELLGNNNAGSTGDPVVDLMPNGPVTFSLQEKRPVYENDITKSPHLSRVRRLAVRQGAKSVISLPLLVDGEVFGFLVLYAPERNFFDDEELKLLQELASDISFALAFIAKGEKVDYLAYHDTLTGLPNRSMFFDALNRQLEAAKAAGRKVALQLFDIDRFRMINDAYGREGADRIIADIADRLRSCVSQSDTVARVGPDSFAVAVSGGWEAQQAGHALEELHGKVFGRPFLLRDEELRVSATCGVALFPGDGMDATALLSNAEAALRDAEAKNARFLFYSSDMNERVADSIRLENRLRQALERDEIVMWYQPKLAVGSGRLTGFEALMRWDDREKNELVEPSLFIPVMEQTGLILDAGRRALDKVAADCAAWPIRPDVPGSIAVNVSLVQLRQAEFVPSVIEAQKLLERAGWMLELELTESVVMENLDVIVPKLQTLRSQGVLISVDDFGTGYSSLAYIARLPIHSLKIDRSFVFSMTEDRNSHAIVKSIVSLAHSLGLKVVAEGVETEAHVEALARLKCDEMQGYRISMPVAGAEVPALIGGGALQPNVE